MKRFGYNLMLVITGGVLITSFLSCAPKKMKSARDYMDISGIWQFETDTSNVGIHTKWFLKKFSDSLRLPGSMEENMKGKPNTDTNALILNRKYLYAGMAWYKKTVEIPEKWAGKQLELILERTKITHVWIDTTYLGTNKSIFTRQVYNLTDVASPGTHTITILVNNSPDSLPINGSHAYSDDTQTNWNGIIGKIGIEASAIKRITGVKSFPDVDKRQFLVKATILTSGKKIKGGRICIRANVLNSRHRITIPEQWYILPEIKSDTMVEFIFHAGEKLPLWSEFKPVYCQFSIELYERNVLTDNQIFYSGLRKFETRGTQFCINGKTTFLRGKHDACVFPLTGYPAMDVDGWYKLFETAKEYGINHYRFHSWTPPEAAFEAADMAGIYLQPELPIWYGFNATDSAQKMLMISYGKEILTNYANHPSFVMFGLGNEIFQDRKILKSMVDSLRNYDSRPLYAQGSNNRLWDPSYATGDDYWTTSRTGKEADNLSTDVRSSNSHLDSREGGILNTLYPNTTWNYEKAIANSPVPVIGHEIGQYQVFPSFSTEIPKYTGILQPLNLMYYKDKLEKNGMGDQADDFFKSSGALAAICYKSEIETAIRTQGFGGFQLLDLQDYPGQGTALVGMLDVFMDNKGLISPEEFRNFCNPVVILCKLEKYCWFGGENFKGEIDLANYGPNDLIDKKLTWQLLTDSDHEVIAKGEYIMSNIKQGKLEDVGSVSLKLPVVEKATKMTLQIEMERNVARNEYPIWVYPNQKDTIDNPKFTIAKELNPSIEAKLKQGGIVLLVPDHNRIKKNTVPGQFIPEFWNYTMFTNLAIQYNGQISPGTMGILVDPEHPLFKEFPTESHSNWQWWIITKNSRPVILDNLGNAFHPIVQVIDNMDRDHKLGLLFEFKCGGGKILICSVDLEAISEKPEGKQFKKAVFDYILSDDFKPTAEINARGIRKILFE